jgi:8-oxo-dGTP pyrophosphatase MutT (NUDIX family)
MEEFTDVIYEKNLKRNAFTSYGLILYTIIEGEIYFIIAQQRDSITIKEIFYQVIRPHDLPKYAMNLTYNEKKKLLNEDFSSLLKDVYINSKNKEFSYILNNREVFQQNVKNLHPYLINKSVGNKENNWVFPRGRKRFNESDIGCVLRETQEETGLNKKFISIHDDIEQYEEYYIGLNNKLYHIIYYIGFIPHDKIKITNTTKTHLRNTVSNEISKVEILPFDEAYKKLDLTKQYILKIVNTVLTLNLKRSNIQRRHSI